MGRYAEAERIFGQALSSWPEGRGTERAGMRLSEIIGKDPLREAARGLFASGRYPEAYNIYAALALSKDKKTADEGTISLAYCSYYMNRWNEALDLFAKWLADNFDAPESAGVQADYKQCQAMIDQNKEWITAVNPPSPPARPGLIVRFLQKAGEWGKKYR
jgi:tetratricopeptide (TPR) repeat protein